MQLTVPEFLSQLNAAKNVNLLDWDSPAPNVYERRFGQLRIQVSLNIRFNRWDWVLLHERSGRLSSGDSEDKDLAQQEALAYAEQWVRNAKMQGLLA